MDIANALQGNDERLRLPPNRKRGLIVLAATVPFAAFGYFFATSDDFDGLTAGSYGQLTLYAFWIGVIAAQVLFAMADLQAPERIDRIAALRRLSLVVRMVAMVGFFANFIGLIVLG